MPSVTVPIATGADDAYVQRTQTSVYPPSGGTLVRDTTSTTMSADRDLTGSNYAIYNFLLSFNAHSSLPAGAIVTGARVVMVATGKLDTHSLSIVMGYYAWDGTSSTDWTSTPESNAHVGTPIANIAVASNTFALTNVDNISTTQATKLRGHVTQRASDAAPTGENWVTFATLEHATQVEPQLIVDYYRPGYGEVRLQARKLGSGTSPQARVEVYETTDLNTLGTLKATPIPDTTVTSTTTQTLSGDFDQSVIGNKNNVVLRVLGTGAQGGLVEVGALEWNGTITHDPFVTVVSSPVTFY